MRCSWRRTGLRLMDGRRRKRFTKCGRFTSRNFHSRTLEVRAEFAEGREDDEFSGAGHDRFVFHVPGVLVRDVNGVEADLHSGIDVAARAVADHPALAFDDFVFVDKASVGDGVFFGDDFDSFEKALQAGALNLCGLFGGFTFGEKNQPVALR